MHTDEHEWIAEHGMEKIATKKRQNICKRYKRQKILENHDCQRPIMDRAPT